MDVVHPLEICLGPVGRDELDRTVLDDADGLVGQRLDADEPLPGEVGFDDVLAAVTVADGVVVVLDLDEKVLLAELLDDLGPAGEAVEAGELRAGRLSHFPCAVDDDDLLQPVFFPELEVDGVVRRGHLDRARAEVALDALVGDDRDGAVPERQDDALTVEVPVALVIGMDGQGRVPEHGLRPRRGHDHGLLRPFDRVADVPELAAQVLVLDFDIGKDGPAVRTAVDEEVIAVDQTLVIE